MLLERKVRKLRTFGISEAYSLLHWSYPRDMRRLAAKQAAQKEEAGNKKPGLYQLKHESFFIFPMC